MFKLPENVINESNLFLVLIDKIDIFRLLSCLREAGKGADTNIAVRLPKLKY